MPDYVKGDSDGSPSQSTSSFGRSRIVNGKKVPLVKKYNGKSFTYVPDPKYVRSNGDER